jgi:hypothetical protein
MCAPVYVVQIFFFTPRAPSAALPPPPPLLQLLFLVNVVVNVYNRRPNTSAQVVPNARNGRLIIQLLMSWGQLAACSNLEGNGIKNKKAIVVSNAINGRLLMLYWKWVKSQPVEISRALALK